MVYNGVVTIEEKYNSLFQKYHVLYDMQSVHPFTCALTSLHNPGQKNMLFIQKRVLYSTTCSVIGPE